MRRFLCFSLCLGLMVSACKKKSAPESVNKARAEGKAGGDGGDGGDGGTVTKKDKAAVLKACLPKINAKMVEKWADAGHEAFYLRRNTVWKTTPADPLVILLVGDENLPLGFAHNTTFGLGTSTATVEANLNAMAASKVIQDQFVARDGNASGWRVHISMKNTDVAIADNQNGGPLEEPAADSGVIIYDRENTIRADGAATHGLLVGHFVDGDPLLQGEWFDCVVDDTTQAVTLESTAAQLTEN